MTNFIPKDETLTEIGFETQKVGAALVIACGALAHELVAIKNASDWNHLTIRCLPAILHNSPEKIPDAVRQAVLKGRADGARSIYVLYADCGTGGLLDNVCEELNVERIAGPHCYSFFSGNAAFEARGDDDMRAFFLTDFLARQFEAFIVKPLGLDRYPELRDMYFGNYEKLIYLAQTDDAILTEKARAHAETLGLAFERRFTGFGDMETALKAFANTDLSEKVANQS